MNPIINQEQKPINELEIQKYQEKNKKKVFKKIIPPHLEKKLPKCIIFYGEPHIFYEENNEKNFKINVEYPVTDYYLQAFKEHYKIKQKRPSPQQMFDAMKNDMNMLYKECKIFFNENPENIRNLKNFKNENSH